MAIDPEVQKWLTALAASDAAPLDTLPIEEARQQMRESSEALGPGEEVSRVEDLEIPGPESPIRVRIYDAAGTGEAPATLYFHGGGWVVGSVDTHDAYCRSLANASKNVIISVDYRLAPEHQYPAAAEDAYAALTWVAANGEHIGAKSNTLTVMGDSAGGNLAAACALLTRDREGPPLTRQVLIYPILDYNFDTDSYLRYMEGFHLTRDAMIWFWDQYAPQRSQREQPYAAPLRADDLSEVAPALIIVAECDPLLDEGEAYAKRLLAAGNKVDLWRYPGTIHGFTRRTKLWEHARECLSDLAEALRATDD